MDKTRALITHFNSMEQDKSTTVSQSLRSSENGLQHTLENSLKEHLQKYFAKSDGKTLETHINDLLYQFKIFLDRYPHVLNEREKMLLAVSIPYRYTKNQHVNLSPTALHWVSIPYRYTKNRLGIRGTRRCL